MSMDRDSIIIRVDSFISYDFQYADSIQDNKDNLLPQNEQTHSLRNERLGSLCVLSANFVWAFNTFYTKVIQRTYPNHFQTVPFLFFRGFMILFISSSTAFISQEHILRLHEIHHKFYFFIRTNLNFFGVTFFIMGLWYLRVSTCQIITTLNPIIVIILSTFILKEAFYFRYVIGIILCTIGSIIIILNENKTQTNTDTDIPSSSFTSGTLIGVSCILLSVFMSGFITLANKVLVQNKVSITTQLFYISLSTLGYSFVFILIMGGLKWTVGYICMCLLQGVFFYLGQVLFNKGIQLIDLNKSVTISYMKIVFVFILGNGLLGEPIFATDILGTVLIVSYMLYNVFKPITKE